MIVDRPEIIYVSSEIFFETRIVINDDDDDG